MPRFKNIDTGYCVDIVVVKNRHNPNDYKVTSYGSQTEAKQAFSKMIRETDLNRYRVYRYRFQGGKGCRWYEMQRTTPHGFVYNPTYRQDGEDDDQT